MTMKFYKEWRNSRSGNSYGENLIGMDVEILWVLGRKKVLCEKIHRGQILWAVEQDKFIEVKIMWINS